MKVKINILFNDVALLNFSIYYSWKNIKMSYKNNKFKVTAPTWKDKFELPYGLYSVSDIQDNLLFWIYHQKTWNSDHNHPIRIYLHKKNRITFIIKIGYYL